MWARNPHRDGFNSCPKARDNQASKMALFKELWIHKPHIKDNTPRNFGTSGQDRNSRRDNHNVSYLSVYEMF